METNKVVARFKDGSLMKGTAQDFSQDKSMFRFETVSGEEQTIDVEQLKALFWVKDFAGDPDRKDLYVDNLDIGGRKIEIKFKDGELMQGNTLDYSPNKSGFILMPSDPNSNNLGVFVVNSASNKIRFLD